MILFFVAAIKIIARATGNINPLIAPASINNKVGRPTNTKTQVVKVIKTDIHHRSCLASQGWKVLKNETDVYDAPITDEMAALQRTTPKIRNPISPAAK